MYAAVFEHVTLTGHWELRDADDLNTHSYGIACHQCGTWWTAPVPRPGQGEQWADGLYSPTIERRRQFLADGVQEILKRVYKVGRTAWSYVLEPEV